MRAHGPEHQANIPQGINEGLAALEVRECDWGLGNIVAKMETMTPGAPDDITRAADSRIHALCLTALQWNKLAIDS